MFKFDGMRGITRRIQDPEHTTHREPRGNPKLPGRLSTRKIIESSQIHKGQLERNRNRIYREEE